MTGSYRVTADGYAGPAGPVRVYSIIVKSTGTAAVVAVLNGAAGDQFDQINGTISKAVQRPYEGGLVFPLGCYIDLDANTSYVVVELEAI